MTSRGTESVSRREFVAGLTLAGGAGSLGWRPGAAGAEPPPETTRIRIVQIPGLCVAPQYVVEDLLRVEGFTDVRYVKETEAFGTAKPLVTGEADVSLVFVGPLILRIDAREPIVVLTGVLVGCFELFAVEGVRAVTDLKGKRMAIDAIGSTPHVFTSTIAAWVGLDPRRDINWAVHPVPEQKQLLAEGKIDALLGFPPTPQELRTRGIGHVVLNSTLDRPWSQYFCCMAAANREFMARHPVATKRALRAILKATDLCALEPERVARLLTDRGFAGNYDYALMTMREVPYNVWRTHNPEDTVRFYALRLHEIGLIRSSPQTIIAQGTDWRFLTELRRELKG